MEIINPMLLGKMYGEMFSFRRRWMASWDLDIWKQCWRRNFKIGDVMDKACMFPGCHLRQEMKEGMPATHTPKNPKRILF